MIVVKQKELDWIIDKLAGTKKVAVLGCGACAAVCFGGGEREVEELCCALQMALQEHDGNTEITGTTCKRACDWEFVEPIAGDLASADMVLSLACGAGTNLLAEKLETTAVMPAVDTLFLGTNTSASSWDERCASCGNCILDETFGLCPVAGCAKTLLNGPCGGSDNGSCEVDKDIACIWAKIVERAKRFGRIDDLEQVVPPKDWSSGRHGGQRTLVRDDLGLKRLCAEETE